MADNLTKSQRKITMQRVRNKDTKPELLVRGLVHRLGYRFRLHRKDLPGKPDLVFPKLNKAIFVHGCFWHGHEGCPASKKPNSNQEYWLPKLKRTKDRDKKNTLLLKEQGWDVLTIWECERDTLSLTRKINQFLNPTPETDTPLRFYEFFAGGGMARLGLGTQWSCIFANEFCNKKSSSYKQNHSSNSELKIKDVAKLKVTEIPGEAQLSWASFPCQDLSEAGNGQGLDGERSGTFWPYWNLMVGLARQLRKVPIIVLENVTGALTSNEGKDFHTIIDTIVNANYRVGTIVIDAVHFVPQSRPRLFIVAADNNINIPDNLLSDGPLDFCHPKKVIDAFASLPGNLKNNWVWWNIPFPDPIQHSLNEIIEENPTGVKWHTKKQTQKLLRMMNETHLEKVREAQKQKRLVVGTLYKRTRSDGNGGRVQRAEVRFDQISGCLRTPSGGSSRQTIMFVNGDEIRSRLLSPREAARLMGLDDNFILPEKYNEAYHLVGDGLVIPAVSWLEQHILTPLANTENLRR